MGGGTTAALPTGTVTFLFSDVEGSTRLLQALGERYAEVLDRHGAVFRQAIRRTGGQEVSTEGDSFFVVFTSALAAVETAVDVQRALAREQWPEGTAVRVRMGLHTGEGTLGGDNYVGLDVNRAARIAASGHGGQVLLSKTTASLVEHDLPTGVTLRDLGEHRLKDLARVEHLFQLEVAGLAGLFPPLRSLDARPNNLPRQRTSFVGREMELDETTRLLSEGRLLTLTGPGGAGKTRLALQLAAGVGEQFDGGVFFVGLGPITDPGLVAVTIAQSLGLPEAQGETRTALDRLVAYLADRQVLLVLDNFEQVLTAAAVVSAVLEASPRTKVVVTSRAVLHLYGEREYPVPALRRPDPHHLPDLASLSQYESVRLFIERAMAVRPDFAVTNANAPAVAEICARLDGLPLAIELAAARVRLLPPEAILTRLGDRLALLVGGPRDLPARQQTLRQAIAWSHDLLRPEERRLFARLSVFVAGCRLPEAEAVCGPPHELGLDVLEGLSALAENSLVTSSAEDPAEPRFGMLETIREFALERLAASGEEEDLRRRHAAAFLALAEDTAPQLYGADRRRCLDRLEREHGNFRAALSWALQRGETATALRLAAALWRLWQMRGHLVEGRRWVERALALPDAARHPQARLRALTAAGGLAHWQMDIEGQRGYYEQALALARDLGDEPAIANALYDLGFPLMYTGELDSASAVWEESVALFTALGDRHGAARARWARAFHRALTGDPAGAEQDLRQALAAFEEFDDAFMQGWVHYGLAHLADREGDYERARAGWSEALRLFAAADDHTGVVFQLELLAKLEATAGAAERAARLAGAATALRAASGTRLTSQFEMTRVPSQVLREDVVRDTATAAAWDEGLAMTRDQAVAYALEAPVPQGA
ncbi:MAG TPA: adenylate/guanylate cyclase domain-containing protein [Nitriliruptorales bacterium]|nr:adenylate/guanylate cyclase domain-containing protein [Nitriliruptorales bacterium]